MVVILLLSAAAGALTFYLHPRAPALHLYQETAGPGEITVLDALHLEREEGVLWIDARARGEFEKEHIPEARLLNEAEWDTLAFELIEVLSTNTRPIIIYCDTQKCEQSERIAEKLRDLGNPDVRVLKGGWQAWRQVRERRQHTPEP